MARSYCHLTKMRAPIPQRCYRCIPLYLTWYAKLCLASYFPRPALWRSHSTSTSSISRLERIMIHINGTDYGTASWSTTLTCLSEFEAQLGYYFLKDATSLKSLVLAAHETAPFNYKDADFSCALPFTSQDLTNLRYLELRNIFISPQLSEFLLRPDSQLRTLILHNCHAQSDDTQRSHTWAWFWGSLDTDEQRFDELRVEYDPPLPVFEDGFLSWDPNNPSKVRRLAASGQELDTMVRRWEELRQEPDTMAFSYGWCTNKYGNFFEGNNDCFNHYERGHDLAAYRSLMTRIRRNAAK
ncbi:hypothetical protein GGR57DRAFT_479925 [Xylariaceae sp. FL1272]|nr:hypothetical protein GGR57DRAFT_479925 [Xylariaceae sp. FL1272]